ncbi:MAG: ComF family protein [Muribaculaceae bacterium]|nr:ComF family protein [Muribaculaceae bacterium]
MDVKGLIRRWCGDLASIIYPPLCEVCDRPLVDGEKIMCLHCNVGLPRTRSHLSARGSVHDRLVSHAPVNRVASWFFYQRTSPYTALIHNAKYHSRPMLARQLGEIFATEIMNDGFFDGIDILVPVPMAWNKEMRRGYNQAVEIARGVANVTGLPIARNLVVVKEHRTQTSRGVYDRYLNVKDLFMIEKPEEFEGRHLLVIDDVLTTGSTILAACDTLWESCSGITLSVLTLGATRLV